MEEAADEQKQTESVDSRVAEIARDFKLEAKTILLYREVFDALDMNGGSLIDQNEMKLGMKAAGRVDITDRQFVKLWKQVDKDGSGGIDFAEFLSFMMSLRETTPENRDPLLAIEDQNLIPDENVEARVDHNTHVVAEKLYHCAAAIGPLGTTLKVDEMIKRTNTGRPSSAPRILNRGFSLENDTAAAAVQKPKMKPAPTDARRLLSQRALGLFAGASSKVLPSSEKNEEEAESPSTKSLESAVPISGNQDDQAAPGVAEEKFSEERDPPAIGTPSSSRVTGTRLQNLHTPVSPSTTVDTAIASPDISPDRLHAPSLLPVVRTHIPPVHLASHPLTNSIKKGDKTPSKPNPSQSTPLHPLSSVDPHPHSIDSPDDRDEEVNSQSFDGELLMHYSPPTSQLGHGSQAANKSRPSSRKQKKKVVSKLVFV
jgi:hypothetical protein